MAISDYSKDNPRKYLRQAPVKKDDLEAFSHRYDAKVRTGTTKMRRMKYDDYAFKDLAPLSPWDEDRFNAKIVDVPAVEIVIAEDDMAKLVQHLHEREQYMNECAELINDRKRSLHYQMQEEQLRQSMPALKKAYDNYRLMLKLVQGKTNE